MQPAQLIEEIELSGNLADDVPSLLTYHRCAHIIPHCEHVANEATKLAIRFHEDPLWAAQAGWLHDISAVIPSAQRVAVAREWRLEVLPEEETFPLIIHQKLSVVMAREVFGIEQESILSAIGCHTTLKANPSGLDKILFVADKIQWDQPGTPPYLASLNAALDISLDAAAFCYLNYLWQRRQELKVVHPWLAEAYHQFKDRAATH